MRFEFEFQFSIHAHTQTLRHNLYWPHMAGWLGTYTLINLCPIAVVVSSRLGSLATLTDWPIPSPRRQFTLFAPSIKQNKAALAALSTTHVLDTNTYTRTRTQRTDPYSPRAFQHLSVIYRYFSLLAHAQRESDNAMRKRRLQRGDGGERWKERAKSSARAKVEKNRTHRQL